MLFNSYAFLLIFLPLALLIYRIADRFPSARIPTLIGLSIAFYGYWDPRFVLLLLPSIVLNWIAARAYEKSRNEIIIPAAVIGNLCVLALFKYADFLTGTFSKVTDIPVDPLHLALPLGISFFTFHHIMYLVDLRRGLAPIYTLDRYTLYICFFPQVLAGPLVRWNEVIDQFGKPAFAPGWPSRMSLGVTFVVVGLAEKTLLGDGLGRTVRAVYAKARTDVLLDGSAWVGVFGFPFQVFFDFSGYSNIAIGVGLLFGMRLPLNFDAPFRATSLQDFWRRWHMTLSRFLRDYLYIPLGGNRQRLAWQLFAVIITMTLGGLWHGAGWNFVLWGLLHGLGLSIAIVWRKYMPRMPTFAGWLLTILFFILTLNVFRAESFDACMRMYQGLAVLPNPFRVEGGRTLMIAMAVAILLPPSHTICRRLTTAPRAAVAVALALTMLTVLVALGDSSNYEFFYFQF